MIIAIQAAVQQNSKFSWLRARDLNPVVNNRCNIIRSGQNGMPHRQRARRKIYVSKQPEVFLELAATLQE